MKWKYNDLFPEENNNFEPGQEITVYNYLKNSDGIGWDWSRGRINPFNPGDKIFIYFSGRGKKRIGRICCLCEIESIRYVNGRKRPLVAYLKKLKWFDDNIAEQLTYEKLKENGLKILRGKVEIPNNDLLLNYINRKIQI